MHVSSESERGDPVGNRLENELAGHGLDIRPRTGLFSRRDYEKPINGKTLVHDVPCNGW